MHEDLFVEKVLGILEETGANPERLKLELTESLLAHNIDDIIVKMDRLRSHGISFELDDFGTGYSSLSYLKRFPVDYVKIDQSFIRDLSVGSEDAAITRAIIAMAHSLELQVVAEGVETEAQLEYLKSQRCDEVQGYLISPAVTATAFAKLLEEQVAVL